MSTYARLNPVSGAFDSLVQLTAPQFAAMQANGKAAYLRPYGVDTQPVPSATQRVADAGIVIDASSARQTWALVDLTAAELDAQSQSAELVQLRQLMAALQADIAAAIVDATTNAQAIVHIHALEVRARRTDRMLLYLVRQQGPAVP